MLIGLVSDTHDNMPLIRRAVEYFNASRVDLVLHAGDLISPICAREFRNLDARMIAVFGNNDGEKILWRQRIEGWGEIHEGRFETVLEGMKVMMMHEPPRRFEELRSDLDVVLYGHTHVPELRVAGKTLIVNPGECGGWLTGKSTIALLSLPQRDVRMVEL